MPLQSLEPGSVGARLAVPGTQQRRDLIATLVLIDFNNGLIYAAQY